jgi:hypothetical protein
MFRYRTARLIAAAAIVTSMAVVGVAPAKEKSEAAEGGDATAVATINGEPVSKADWAAIMKADSWYGPELKTKPPYSDQMQGRPYEDFFFKEEVLKIRVMAQKYKEELPQMKATIDDLRSKAVGGADFGELAKVSSQDAGSAPKGGLAEAPDAKGVDAGTVEFKDMVFPFNRVMMKMKEGEISEPIMTVFGYHILKVDRVLPAMPSEAKGKRVAVRHILIKFPSPNARAESEQLAKDAKVEVLDKSLCKKLPTYCPPQG